MLSTLVVILILGSGALASVFNPQQVFFPPEDVPNPVVQWGIGLAATPSHSAVIISGFDNVTTTICAQVLKRSTTTGLYTQYGTVMSGHPMAALHDYLQTDPAPAFISEDEEIVIWGFNDAPTSGALSFSRFNSPPEMFGTAYGFLYVYQDDGTEFQFRGNLVDPDTSNSRLWASDVHGTPDGSVIVVGAPVYPYTNTVPGAVVVFNLVSTNPLSYNIARVIERSDGSLTLWGYNNVVSSDGRYIVTGSFANNLVYVYDASANYTEVRVFTNPEVTNNWFGYSVAIASDNYRIAIGAFRYSGGSFVGQTYTYDYNITSEEWSADPVVHDWANKTGPTPGQGASVSFSKDGNLLAFGMPYGAGGSHGEIGVFKYLPDNETWIDLDAVTVFNITAAPDEPINIGWPSTVHTLISEDGCHLFGPGPGNIPIDSGYVFAYTDPNCVPPAPQMPPATPETPTATPTQIPPETTTPDQRDKGGATVGVISAVFGVTLVVAFYFVYLYR